MFSIFFRSDPVPVGDKFADRLAPSSLLSCLNAMVPGLQVVVSVLAGMVGNKMLEWSDLDNESRPQSSRT